jgi:integrase
MIKRVYRPSRLKNGKQVVGRLYRGKYRLHPRDKIKYVALHTNDKQVAEERLSKIVREEEREGAGLLAPKHEREAAQKKLAEHVEAFVADRRAMGRDEKYVRELRKKLLRLIDECHWQFARHVTPESFCAWRAKQSKASKTLNEYLITISGLMSWLEQSLGPNPLRFVEKVQAAGDSSRPRRAAAPDQLRRLVAVAGERGIIYVVAASTGLRRGELKALEWRDVFLDMPQPFIAVRSSIAKNHKFVMQPLPLYVADELRKSRSPTVSPNDRVFSQGVPSMAVYRKDLEAAWIEYQDAEGRYLDFHALRTTFGTLLTLESKSQRTVMELMRHSDMKLTSKVYTDARMLPVSETVGMLPKFIGQELDAQIDAQSLVPIGLSVSTDVPKHAGETKLLTAGDQAFSPAESASVLVSPEGEDGARCRVRTCDSNPTKDVIVVRR